MLLELPIQHYKVRTNSVIWDSVRIWGPLSHAISNARGPTTLQIPMNIKRQIIITLKQLSKRCTILLHKDLILDKTLLHREIYTYIEYGAAICRAFIKEDVGSFDI